MRRAKKKLDPKTLWIVTDSRQALSPPFYHKELARAVLKELAKDAQGLELSNTEVGDDGLEHLSQLMELHTIDLTYTNVGPRGGKPLGSAREVADFDQRIDQGMFQHAIDFTAERLEQRRRRRGIANASQRGGGLATNRRLVRGKLSN